MMNIATANTSKAAKWQNKRTTWEKLVDSLRVTKRTSETIKQYLSYSKDKQGEIKDVGGFVGGYLKDGRRKNGHVVSRQLVCLDVDFGGLDVWEAFTMLGYAGCMYTTHKHTPQNPRFRIVLPLASEVDAEQYEAVARVIASWLGIDNFDDTTYQATRLMYWPSTAKDGDYLFDVVDGPWLAPGEALDELPDWKDATTWPVSSRVRTAVSDKRADKAEDPTNKDGIVGAFCRAYGIGEAIAEFLPDVYTPCESMGQDRYTYEGGSTSGGLVVYDDLFAYSHHSTDPCGGRLCNAFDLVRLHKYGELDDNVRALDAGKMPSFRAMSEWAAGLKEVKREVLRERKVSADEYGDEGTILPADADNDDWIDDLETEKNGRTAKNTIANVVLVLKHDDGLKGRFGFNEFEQRETAVRALPWDKPGERYPRPLADSDDAELRLYLERVYGINSRAQVTDGLTVAVRANAYHPIKDYLDGLEWDGGERLDTLFIDLFGAEDSAYTRAVTRKAFTAAVARVYRPGCKFDYVPVLVGDQGIGKSTVLAKMGGAWFSDSVTTLTGKEALESIQGSWIIELGELAGLRRAEVDAVKHFVSKKEDRFRVAYGKRVEHFPRRCVFFGTTNEDDFLRDVTGNRRFWVVNTKGGVPFVDFADYLDAEVVAQIWAEAKFRFEEGEPLYLDSSLEVEARKVQDAHLEKDERAGLVKAYLKRKLPHLWKTMGVDERRAWLADAKNVGTNKRKKVCVLEIWAECLERDPTMITRRDSFEIGRIMKTLQGWGASGKVGRFPNYGVQKSFEKK
jgi:putative DNA primase/helicase